MENTVLEGNIDRIETFQKRMLLTLNRATYAPHLTGHYALNLPAYMHFTSPIRRYADLINHRQISAFIQNEKPHYDIDALNKIAEQINKLQNEQKDKKAEYLKEKDKAETRKTIEAEQLNDLDSKQFYKVIKIAANEDLLNENVEKQIYNRLLNNELKARDLFTILFEGNKENENWHKIKYEVMTYLEKNPFYATSIVIIGTQVLDWSSLQYETNSSGEAHKKLFSSVASVVIDGVTFSSEPQTASYKKQAEQFAAISLLEIILNIKSRKRFLVNIDDLRDDKVAPTENFKGVLHRLCQQNKWDTPKYKSSMSGDEHQPIFNVVSEIVIDGEVYTSKPGVGPNIKHAEQLAAENLLEIIPGGVNNISTTNAISKNTPVAEAHFISWLQDHYQRSKLPVPKYSFVNKFDGFECKCTVNAPDGSVREFSGEGTSKKDAKRNAAKLAYDKIMPLFEIKKGYQN
jgi:ribonuclease R